MYPLYLFKPLTFLLSHYWYRLPVNPLLPWGTTSTWMYPFSLTLFPHLSLYLHGGCTSVSVLSAPTTRPPTEWPWELPLEPLAATTVYSTVSLTWTLSPMHRLQILFLYPTTAPLYPACDQFMWLLSEFHMTSTPLCPPVPSTYLLWFSAPYSLRSILGILHGLSPPSSPLPQTQPTKLAKQQNHLNHSPIKYFQHLGICPLPLKYIYQPDPDLPCPTDVHKIIVQSSSYWSRVITRYLNCVTLSTSESTSLPYKMNSISPNIWANPKYLRCNHISVSWSQMAVYLWFYSLSAGLFIQQLVHHGSVAGNSCIILTLNFQGLYMKCLRILPGLC